MAAAFTYPGVYIQEISSGVHTITGVATSIAAFVGWANMGPTDKATLVQSWTEFENQFGGLTNSQGTPNYLGYAVNQFFGNGGSQTYIVRLVATDAKFATVQVPGAGGATSFKARAIDEGQWANLYGIRILKNDFDPNRFGLLVVYTPASGGPESTVETFQNLSLDPADPQGRGITSLVNDPGTGSQTIQIVAPVTANLPTFNPMAVPPNAPVPPYVLGVGAGNDPGADGTVLIPGTTDFHTALNANGSVTGVHLLDTVPIFNLLCVPGETDPGTISTLQTYCRDHRVFYIVDCEQTAIFSSFPNGPVGITGDDAINSAFYFPWVNARDQQGRINQHPPCGFIAGLYAKTDATRGVWKAPAGIDASLRGEHGLTVSLNDSQNGLLNPLAINCIRNFPVYGDVIWGARTLRGNDQIGSEWKYVPIRRFALFLESSLYNGTQWVVFEPNDERLWSQIRLNVGAFMQGLFLQGAFQGTSRQQAYFVKCDGENNPQSSIDQGIVNVLVGFAPLYPAEFVVIQIQQMAGQV